MDYEKIKGLHTIHWADRVDAHQELDESPHSYQVSMRLRRMYRALQKEPKLRYARTLTEAMKLLKLPKEERRKKLEALEKDDADTKRFRKRRFPNHGDIRYR